MLWFVLGDMATYYILRQFGLGDMLAKAWAVDFAYKSVGPEGSKQRKIVRHVSRHETAKLPAGG